MAMERLDKILLERNPELTRSRIEGLIKAGYVRTNGIIATKAGAKVAPDAEIELVLPPPVPATPLAEDIPLSIIYEDEHIIVIDKPAGLVVHPAPGHATGTLVNALLAHCPQIADLGCRERPGIVHRLDQETSGIIVVAKTQEAMLALSRAFASHRDMEKIYLAICHGRPRLDSGRIENLLGRHPVDRKRFAIVERGGKPAITNWKLLSQAQSTSQPSPVSLIECRIETGRTHQIRIHMASLGCPVIGDKTYGKSALDHRLPVPPMRQMLHASRLTLYHPVSHKLLTFSSPIPQDFLPYLH